MATGISLAGRPPAPSWGPIRSRSSLWNQSPKYCPRVLPHCPQIPPKFSFIRAAISGSPQHEENTANAPPPPPPPQRKKPRRLQKTFQHLAHRPVPRPRYLLWTSSAVFVFLMRRVIFEELARWPGFFVELWELLKALGMFVAKLLALHAKDTTVWTVTYFGWAGLALTDLYNFIVDYAPVRGLVTMMALTTAVVSLGEAVRPNAADQPWIIRLATLTGLGAYLHIWDFALTLIILAALSAASYLRHRDVVTALLPSVATLVAVGRPIVQAPAMAAYLILAMYVHWSAPESRDKKKVEARRWKSPTIFVAFTIAIGINLSVNWLRARHLVWLAT